MSVKLRLRRTVSKGYSAYFDLYAKGKRQCEYTGVYLSKDYLHALKDKTGVPVRDSKGKPLYPKVFEDDKSKLELLEKIRLQRELQLKNEEYGFTDSRIKNINLMDYVAEIYREKKSKNYFNLLSQLKNCFGNSLSFAEADEKTVERFTSYLKKQAGLCSNSCCTYLASLSAVFNEAIRDKIITINPCKLIPLHLKPKQEESKRTFLTIEELRILSATPIKEKSYQVKEAFLFCSLTGLRISDLLKIGYSDLKDGILQYRQKKSRKQFHYLPLSLQAQSIIKDLTVDPKGELIFWELSRMVSYSQGLKLLDDWVNSAGIKKKVTWHVGRHTYATLLISVGEDIYTVSKLLGHAHVGVTEKYAKIINTKKIEAVNRIPKVV